jgi:hypothetical protein
MAKRGRNTDGQPDELVLFRELVVVEQVEPTHALIRAAANRTRRRFVRDQSTPGGATQCPLPPGREAERLAHSLALTSAGAWRWHGGGGRGGMGT